MNGNNVLLDTNIVLYLLNGEETLIPLLEDKNLYLSFISQLELLSAKYLKPEDFRKSNNLFQNVQLLILHLKLKRIR